MSKKVTTQICAAFIGGKTLTVGNSFTNGSQLFLHGNKIAEKGADGLYITNAGWQSNTTKERLNGLPNVSIYQAKGEWYLNGNRWDGKLTKIS